MVYICFFGVYICRLEFCIFPSPQQRPQCSCQYPRPPSQNAVRPPRGDTLLRRRPRPMFGSSSRPPNTTPSLWWVFVVRSQSRAFFISTALQQLALLPHKKISYGFNSQAWFTTGWSLQVLLVFAPVTFWHSSFLTKFKTSTSLQLKSLKLCFCECKWLLVFLCSLTINCRLVQGDAPPSARGTQSRVIKRGTFLYVVALRHRQQTKQTAAKIRVHGFKNSGNIPTRGRKEVKKDNRFEESGHSMYRLQWPWCRPIAIVLGNTRYLQFWKSFEEQSNNSAHSTATHGGSGCRKSRHSNWKLWRHKL